MGIKSKDPLYLLGNPNALYCRYQIDLKASELQHFLIKRPKARIFKFKENVDQGSNHENKTLKRLTKAIEMRQIELSYQVEFLLFQQG